MLPDSDHRALDISSVTSEIDAVFFETRGLDRVADVLSNPASEAFDTRQTRAGAPIARPSSIYAIGLNYRDHIAEAGMETPSEPVVFTKAPNPAHGIPATERGLGDHTSPLRPRPLSRTRSANTHHGPFGEITQNT